jgi:DNA-binding beta-propeller fold protein YncE
MSTTRRHGLEDQKGIAGSAPAPRNAGSRRSLLSGAGAFALATSGLLLPATSPLLAGNRKGKGKGKKKGRGGNVVVCHSGDTLRVPRYAVRAIKLDGGFLGACPPDAPPPQPPTSCAPDTRQWTAQAVLGTAPLPGGVAVSADGQTLLVAEIENHRIEVWERSGGAFVQRPSFGRQSLGGPNGFFTPIGVAVAADGRTAWVADNLNYRISVWARSGNTWANQATFGSRGNGPDQFQGPVGVAVSADGQTAWVADANTHRVSVWAKSGAAWVNQATFGSRGEAADQFLSPRGVAVSADGQTVWVTNTQNHRVSVWTKSGSTWAPLTTFGSRGDGPSQFNIPAGVAASADGQTVWVGDFANNRVSVWIRSGNSWTNHATFGRRGAAPNEFRGPDWVAVADDEQTVWVTDTGNRRVSEWALTCPLA